VNDASSTQTVRTANRGITDKQRMQADKATDNWLLYGLPYDNQRFSPLKAINARNVGKLQPATIIQTGIAGSFENNSIVHDGTMFVSTWYYHVIAYDVLTGKQLWSYEPKPRYTQRYCGLDSCCVAMADGRVFVGQFDGNLVALDARTGKVERTVSVGDLREAFSLTVAPQVYDGMVFVGTSGAEYPTRNFVETYDAKTCQSRPRWPEGVYLRRFFALAFP
jgi:glucose dehydrogenase